MTQATEFKLELENVVLEKPVKATILGLGYCIHRGIMTATVKLDDSPVNVKLKSINPSGVPEDLIREFVGRDVTIDPSGFVVITETTAVKNDAVKTKKRGAAKEDYAQILEGI